MKELPPSFKRLIPLVDHHALHRMPKKKRLRHADECYWSQEQSADTARHSIACQDSEYWAQVQSADTASNLIARQDFEYRAQEQSVISTR
jgi:hypothetical protein